MAWRPAMSLIVLRDQLQAAYPRARPPATDVASWGFIGNPATHSADSDHMPHNFPGWGSEIVTAHDFPHRPDLGLNAGTVTEYLRLSRDPRIKYVIYNRRLFSSYSTTTRAAWSWGTYSGSNPHTDHAHVSVVGDARADGRQAWAIGAASMDLTTDPNFRALIYRMLGLISMTDPINNTVSSTPDPNNLARTLRAIEAAVQQPSAVTLTTEQLADLRAALVAAVRDAVSGLDLATVVREEVAEVIRNTRLSTDL
jgi:hypothetical protein